MRAEPRGSCLFTLCGGNLLVGLAFVTTCRPSARVGLVLRKIDPAPDRFLRHGAD
jgi:hypothetical protein